MLHGLSYAIASTAVMTTAQRVIPPARRAEGTGFFALGNTLSTALGPALGLFLVGQFSYRALFTTTIAVAVVSLVLGVLLGATAGERAAAEESRGAQRPSFHASDIADGRVVPIGVHADRGRELLGRDHLPDELLGAARHADGCLGVLPGLCRGNVHLPLLPWSYSGRTGR